MDEEVKLFIEKWQKSRCLSKVPKTIPAKLLDNKEFVLEVLKSIEITFPLLEFVSKTLQKDQDVIAEALKQNVENWRFIPKDVLYKKDIFLLTLNYVSKYEFFRGMPDKLKDDKEVILEIVKRDGYDLNVASSRLKDDEEVAMVAASSNASSLFYMSNRVKKNKEIVLKALSEYNDPSSGTEFALSKYIPEELRDDYDVVLALVKGSGYCLHDISERLKDNEDIVKVAISHPHELSDRFIMEYPKRVEFSYQYASVRLRNDKEIIRLAVKNNPALYSWLPLSLRDDKEMAFEACIAFTDNIGRFPKEYYSDKDFVVSLIKNLETGSFVYRDAATEIKEDPEVVELILSKSLGNYYYLPFKYKMDEKIIRRVLKDDIRTIGGGVYVKYIKKGDKYFASVRFNKESLQFASNVLKAFASTAGSFQAEVNEAAESLKPDEDAKNMTLEFEVSKQDIIDSFNTKSSAYSSNYLPEDLLNDEDFIFTLFKKGITSLYFCAPKLKESMEFMKQALEISYSGAFPYIPSSLWENDEFVEYITSLCERKNFQGGGLLQKVPARYKDNKEYALRVLKLNPYDYCYLSSNLKKDKDIGLFIISHAPHCLERLDPVLRDDFDIVSIAVKHDGHLSRYASPRVKELLKKK